MTQSAGQQGAGQKGGKGEGNRQSIEQSRGLGTRSISPGVLDAPATIPSEVAPFEMPEPGQVFNVDPTVDKYVGPLAGILDVASNFAPYVGQVKNIGSNVFGLAEDVSDMFGGYNLGSIFGSFGDVVGAPFKSVYRNISDKVVSGEMDPDPLGYLGGRLGIGQGNYQSTTDLADLARDALGHGIGLASGFGAFGGINNAIGSAISPISNYLGLGTTALDLVGDIAGVDELSNVSNLINTLTTGEGLAQGLVDAAFSIGTGTPKGIFSGLSETDVTDIIENNINSNVPSGHSLGDGSWMGDDGRYYSPSEFTALTKSPKNTVRATGSNNTDLLKLLASLTGA